MELHNINKLPSKPVLCLSCMRTFIYILILLFSFQPASWAAVNAGIIGPDEFEHSGIAFHADANGDSQKNASTAHHAAPEHNCIQAMHSSAGDASNCLNKCLDYCNSIAGLALSVSELLKTHVYMRYPPATAYTFPSLMESPETQPPKSA